MVSNSDHCNATLGYPVLNIPGWVDTVTPAYKLLRKRVTKKYGLITLFSSMCLMVLLGIINWMYKRYYYTWNKRLKAIYHSHYVSYVMFVNSGVYKIILFWTVYTVLILFPQTNNDLMFITKRLGRMAMTLMPTLFFLTLRPSPLPKTLYLTLVPIHKWLSRIVVVQSLLHTVFYVAYFIHSRTVFKTYALKQIYGWIPMSAFIIITITSLAPIRRKSFATFYFNHYILSWILIGFLYFHSRPPAKTVTFLNVSILTYQIFLRFTNTSLVPITVKNVSSNLKIVEIPKDSIPQGRFDFKHSIVPCSHLRMQKYYANPFKNFFYRFIAPLAHPYSIASVPSDKSIVLVVRNTNFDLNNIDKYYITGSYDPDLEFFSLSTKPIRTCNFKSLFKRLREQSERQAIMQKNSNIITLSSHYEISATRVLMIIGGSGISVALPLLRILNIQGIPSKIIWVIKDIEDLKLFKHFKNIDINSFEIYLTSKTYKFEYLRENILRLDELFGKLEEDQGLLLHPTEPLHPRDNGYLEEIDFTNFESTLIPSKNNSAIDTLTADNFLPLSSVPLRKRGRSRSLSSVDTPPPGVGSYTKSVTNKLSFLDRLNLDTYLRTDEDDQDDDDIEGSNADNVGVNISKNFTNYENKTVSDRRKRGRSFLFRTERNVSNYGATVSKKKSKKTHRHSFHSKTSKDNEEFRVPILIRTDQRPNGGYSAMLKQLKIYKGRPTLGQDDFNWCLNHVCGNEMDETPSHHHHINETTGLLDISPKGLEHQKGGAVECCNAMRSTDLDEVLNKVWVIGVGPQGLTEKTKLWARENRLNFHEESFSV